MNGRWTFGIPVPAIASTLNVLVGGQIVSTFKEGTEPFDVWLQADKKYRSDSKDFLALTILSLTAGSVKLGSLAKLKEKQGSSQIDRFNRPRTVTLMAHPDRISLYDAVQYARRSVTEMNLPSEYGIVFGGQDQRTAKIAPGRLFALG